MASLPPRPESPPKLRDDRNERDRDRRAAVPMGSSRPPRPLPERERLYLPSRTDTYIPGGYDGRRENDRRDYDSRDRERDRFRDSDRDKERRRDYDRSPRRWEDRERSHPYERDRGSYRRPVSPLRRYGPGPSRRDSRSPPRRRMYRSRSRSRSPSHRSRPRSRSPSPRRSPSKRIKLGTHSIGDGTRSRSPHRRSRSRGRSKSVEKKRPSTSLIPQVDEQKRTTSTSDITLIKKEEESGIIVNTEIPSIKTEDRPVELPCSDSNPIQPPLQSNNLKEETRLSLPHKPSHLELDDRILSQPSIKVEETQADMPNSNSPPALPESKNQAIKVDTSVDVEVKKMEVNSPKLTPINSNNPTRSPSPHSSRNTADHQRPNLPTGPQRSWPNRSPPRGPRLHLRSNIPNSNQPPPPYPPGRRDSRRPFAIPVQASFPLSSPRVETEVKLPLIPKYDKTKGWENDISSHETEFSKQRPIRLAHAHQDINHIQALQRALHELQMASIDLHAAEGRRRVADIQLDKAKTGSLGIDASDLVEI